MMILCELANYQPLLRLQTWLLERVIAAQLSSHDLRWGLLALALNLLAAAWALGRRRLYRPAATAQAAAKTLLTPWWQQGSASVADKA